MVDVGTGGGKGCRGPAYGLILDVLRLCRGPARACPPPPARRPAGPTSTASPATRAGFGRRSPGGASRARPPRGRAPEPVPARPVARRAGSRSPPPGGFLARGGMQRASLLFSAAQPTPAPAQPHEPRPAADCNRGQRPSTQQALPRPRPGYAPSPHRLFPPHLPRSAATTSPTPTVSAADGSDRFVTPARPRTNGCDHHLLAEDPAQWLPTPHVAARLLADQRHRGLHRPCTPCTP